ncbi:MAG TPA: bifunctional precorrin-2 dehydrogenase/sirohydrochlorin ferrochelatase [Flavisolibacter sp.]|jgi:siroheme synthase-like protein|nr:bifunctional precorrin-2 dehydrogenase/sirohydrochlorin ferrochelatase [Flavisolibacter sp.]
MSQSYNDKETNRLFPVFLKLENLSVLIVGGGKIGLEKLSAILSNSPETDIKIVSITISEEVRKLANNYPNVELKERVFLPLDVDNRDVVIVAIDDKKESKRIRDIVKEKKKLVNVADKPELCDFYMGSIVQKGNLKIGISTNGKSPTIAKRLKDLFNELLPEEIDELLDNMQSIRNELKGDFNDKVNRLNAITKDFILDKEKKRE